MEPIAIIGIGCRFPGEASSARAFWHLLTEGIDAIAAAPSEREELYQAYTTGKEPGTLLTLQGGFLANIDSFAASFFGITPQEARMMDPQQRLLLEVAWESLEDAALAPPSLAGSRTGVFIGMWTNDYQDALYQSTEDVDLYTTTGTGRYAASGRLSYCFDLRGPSMTIDTACSSSLVAAHLACESLRSGECDLALVGGSNVILQPHLSIGYAQSHLLSPDGRCKFGDQQANGYVRSEGVAVIVLKALAKAQADGDPIYALIRSSAVNNDGRSSGSLVKPGLSAQEDLMRTVYRKAGVLPGDVQYVEAHGTGTSAGDSVELQAIGHVMCDGHTTEQPCYVGSLKTNIGHTEGTSGVAGIIKLALALQHHQLPPSLHFTTPNASIPWSALPITIPRTLTPIEKGTPVRASVNSYGITGTNAHMLLEEWTTQHEPEDTQHSLYLVTLSAQTPASLYQLASSYQQRLQEQPALRMGDISLTTTLGRAQFEHRLALIAATTSELSQKLTAFLDGSAAGEEETPESSSHAGTVAFLFMGKHDDPSFLSTIGPQLYQSHTTLRQEFERCATLMVPYLDQPLLPFLLASSQEAQHHDPVYTALSLFTIEYALARLWMQWGIIPASVTGTGIGMYVAACIAGVLRLEEALLLTLQHSKLHARSSASLPGDGSLLAFPDASPSGATPSEIALVSPLTGQAPGEEVSSAAFWQSWMRQSISPAYDGDEIRILGCTLSLEMGLPALRPAPATDNPLRVSCLSRSRSAWEQVLTALGICYIHQLPINWQAFAERSPYQRISLPTYPFQRESYPLIHARKRGEQTTNHREEPALLHLLAKEKNEKKRREIIQTYVHTSVALVLGRDPALPMQKQRGFWELGMTSLMAVELQTRLQSAIGKSLLPTLPFDYPTIQSMSDYIAQEMLEIDHAEAVTPGSKGPIATLSEEQLINDLSEDDINSLLNQELDALLRKGID